jgi:thioredoxin reductase (NADPH)
MSTPRPVAAMRSLNHTYPATASGAKATMSRYLIERIEATPNIALDFNKEVGCLDGTKDGGLQRLRTRCRLSGDELDMEIRNLFLFVGADPATGWLEGCGVALDRHSVFGVFAVGDVRSGSVKRVGGAIGEGAQVVAALHASLGDERKASTLRGRKDSARRL